MPLVEYSTEGAVALIQLTRPPVNALSDAVAEQLEAAIEEASDDAIRAVVIYGEPHFAAGADITGFRTAHESGSQEALASGISDVFRKLERLPKPVIAAVRGYALGGGLELAMSADFRYLSDDAKVGQPEINLGLIPGAGGTQRLPRLVGFARAKEINYSGRHVDAEEALEIGLCEKVVPADQLLATTMADAAEWATRATKGIAAAKQAMNEGWGKPIDEALAEERRAFDRVFWTDDAREGVAAFLEKRKPEFEGR